MNQSLPPHFAERVLELESLLDDNRSIELIQDLNQLYRIAIDHYVEFELKKAQHFQRKMTRLLADPDTLTLIESSQPQKLTLLRSPRLATKSKIKDEVNKFNNCSKEYIKNILQQSQKALKKSENLKLKDITRQEQNLYNRIMLKKCKSQEKLLLGACK